MNLTRFCAVFGIANVLLYSNAFAGDTLINFDDVSSSHWWNYSPTINTQYTNQGVTFGGDLKIVKASYWGISGYSHANILGWVASIGANSEVLSFSTPVQEFSISVGSDSYGTATVTAYDADGNELETESGPLPFQ